MTMDDFDNLVDDATHAVNDLIPHSMLAGRDVVDREGLLVRINDALTPVLRDFAEPAEQHGHDPHPLRAGTIAAFVSELIEAHMQKCESAGENPDDQPAHIISEAFEAQANIASIAFAADDFSARLYLLLEDGAAFRLTVDRVEDV